MTRLGQMAVDAGWHHAEVSVAILGLTVAELAHKAGKPAAREVLQQAMDALA